MGVITILYSSFIVGFERLVSTIIENEYQDAKTIQMLNGAIIYKTKDLNQMVTSPFLNNHFFVLKQAKANNIVDFINQLSTVRLKKAKNRKSFRVIISDQNNLVSINNAVLSRLEKKIERETGHVLNRVKPDIEYWVLKRSEGIILFMERINKHKSFDKTLAKGELRDDLCYFLNYLSKPNKNDIYLDCFCGSGALIKNRMKMSEYNMIFGIDIEGSYIQKLRKAYKKNNLIFKHTDFFDFKFDDGFIDKIVTDPPWGLFEKMDNLPKFYQDFIDEARRILKKSGILVVLTARKEEMKQLKTDLTLIDTYDILVSGKKAIVCVFANLQNANMQNEKQK